MLGLFVCPYLCLTKRAFNNTSTLSLEKCRSVLPEPFTGNSGSLLITHSVLAIKFKFCFICLRLPCTPIHLPLVVLTIGIRAYAPDIRFNHLRV